MCVRVPSCPLARRRRTNTTERYDGQTLRVRVKYTGYRLSSPPTATYAYYVATNDLEAKLVYNSHGANASERVLSDLHGLQLLFSQEADLTRSAATDPTAAGPAYPQGSCSLA